MGKAIERKTLPKMPTDEDFADIAEVAAFSSGEAENFRDYLVARLAAITEDLLDEQVYNRDRFKAQKRVIAALRHLADEIGSLSGPVARKIESIFGCFNSESFGRLDAAMYDDRPPGADLLTKATLHELLNALDTLVARLEGNVDLEHWRRKGYIDPETGKWVLPEAGGSPGHPGRRWLCADLIHFYRFHLMRVATSTPGGRLDRFVAAVFKAVGWGEDTGLLVQRALAKGRRKQTKRRRPLPQWPRCSVQLPQNSPVLPMGCE